MNPFITFEGVTFNRSHIKAISGPSIDPENPDHKPFFYVLLTDDFQWEFTAQTHDELMDLRTRLIQALNS